MTRKETYEKLLKDTSEELKIDSNIIQELVNFQWRSAYQAMSKKENFSIEISGFGRFSLREKSIERRLKKLNSILGGYNRFLEKEDNEKKRETLLKKINSITEEIKFLNYKLECLLDLNK